MPLGLSLAPAVAGAAPDPSATVTASITVLEPMGVAHASDMAVATTRRPRSGVAMSAATPGEYQLSGAHGQVFSLEVSRNLRLSDGKGNLLGAKLRQSHTVARHLGRTRTAAPARADHVRIGGDVAVAANAVGGLYTGAFSVVVNYN